MRYLISLLLIGLASTAAAGSIRPAACATDANTEDPAFKSLVKNSNQNLCKSLGLPRNCTDAEAKAKDPNATIYAVSLSGFQDYTSPIYCGLLHGMAVSELKRRAADDIAARWLLADPTLQDQIDAQLPQLP